MCPRCRRGCGSWAPSLICEPGQEYVDAVHSGSLCELLVAELAQLGLGLGLGAQLAAVSSGQLGALLVCAGVCKYPFLLFRAHCLCIELVCLRRPSPAARVRRPGRLGEVPKVETETPATVNSRTT